MLGLTFAAIAVAIGAPAADAGQYRVLQINLCNSGEAPCYTGRAPSGAIALITSRRPAVVTLNEVCAPDLRAIRLGTGYVGVFTQSGSRRCRNGSRFGNAIAFPPGTRLGRPQRVEYANQDPDPERRTLTCVPANRVTACVTHLSTETPRFSQATQMFGIVGRHARRGATVAGGDWNIAFPIAQRYVPAGMFRKGDGDVQHVMVSDSFRFVGRRKQRVAWTDHPVFEVDLQR